MLIYALLMTLNAKAAGFLCGEAKVIAGKSCESLYVVFDFQGCDESPSTPVEVHCQKDSAFASVEGNKFSYSSPLKQVNGIWTFTEKLAQTKIVQHRTPTATIAQATPPAFIGPLKSPPPTTTEAEPSSDPTPEVSLPSKPMEQIPVEMGKIKANGHFRFRTENLKETSYAFGEDSISLMRLRASLEYTPKARARYVLTPQLSKVFGANIYTPLDGSNNINLETSGSTHDTSISAHEAYLDYRASEDFNFIIGRQMLSYGDELVVGRADWGFVGRSFDAIRFKIKGDRFTTDGFVSKLTNSNTYDNSLDDVNFHGLSLGWTDGAWMENLDVYGFFKEITGAGTNFWTYGFRWVAHPGWFYLRTESHNQSGEYGPPSAFLFDSELGFKSAYPVQFTLEFIRAGSGYQSMYGSTHAKMGVSDLLSYRNLNTGAAHLKVNWSSRYSTQIDGFTYARDNLEQPAFFNSGNSFGGANTERPVGQELDVRFQASFSELEMEIGYANFAPGRYLKTQLTEINENLRFTYLQLSSNF